jgi:hypothetical protein
MRLIVLAVVLVVTAWAQTCLNAKGEAVSWWVIMKVPPKIGKVGYGYYDSTIKTGKFSYIDAKVDVGDTPLTRTENLINSMKL